MDTDIIMVVPKRRYTVKWLIFASAIACQSLSAGEWQLQPSLLLDAYGYQLKNAQQVGWDEGAAIGATPELALTFDSKNLDSTFNWKQKHVFYDDAQRSDKSFDYINFDNRLSAWDNRIIWTVDAGRGYRVRNTRRGLFTDEITGFADLSRTEQLGSSLQISTARHKDTQASLGVSARKLSSETPINNDDLGDFNNEFYSANLNLGKRNRGNEFYWQLNGRYAESIRSIGNDLTSENAAVKVGVPLISKLAWVSQARYENNQIFTNYDNEFVSVGTGIEYHIGAASYINVTYNHYTTKQLVDENGEYWALDMLLAPTRRSSLKATIDRRYYGRSFNVAGSYRLQHLSASLSYNERVNVNSFLEQELADLGLFVCPGAFSGFTDCFLPPTVNYELQAGESLQNFVQTVFEINQSVVLRKAAALNIAYDKNRLVLGFNAGRAEDEYVESDRLNRTESISVSAKWRLTPLMSLTSQYSWYKLMYATEQRTDKNIQLSAGVSMELNQHSDISVNLRRIERTSNQQQFDLEENRIWLSYAYQF
jgi:uncharacterized protein (PEP-CTERM system associated)